MNSQKLPIGRKSYKGFGNRLDSFLSGTPCNELSGSKIVGHDMVEKQ
jgi:hypothetical protein